MARLLDIKVGKTVWVKKGTTNVNCFGEEYEVDQFVGAECIVTNVDAQYSFYPVGVKNPDGESYWFPADWISLTPPKDVSLKENPTVEEMPTICNTILSNSKVTVKALTEKLYVAHWDGDTTSPGTIEDCVKEMKDNWGADDDDIQTHVQFYEVAPVRVKYTPPGEAKYEVVEA